MIKKIIFPISIVVNVILAAVCLMIILSALDGLMFDYVHEDAIRPDSLRTYLDRENYGVAAALSHPIRGEAKVADEDIDYYMLGEYADSLFLKEIFARSEDKDTYNAFEDRLSEIRNEMPEYDKIFDKIDLSIDNAFFDK